MNTKKTYFIIAVIMFCSSCFVNSRTIEGNGKVVTRTISVSDYSEISISGSMDVEYEESSAAPFLSVTLDENLFEYITAEVNGSELKIEHRRENGRGINLRSTVFKVKTNSRSMEELNLAGSGDVLARNLSASSDVKFNLAGSGNINVEQMKNKSVECNLSGSGNIVISGQTSTAKYNIAGSGSIKAFNFQADDAEANIVGSGDIELCAVSNLNASLVGSGNVRYKGDPQVKSSKMGSGRVYKD
ncbi:MAG: DUF2807 domain-containing protein [Tannerellaceae bacterium]|jgi:hypothetical protein|nr:DUF2807 domain-containing protein [Tannerellaceae bacterium]